MVVVNCGHATHAGWGEEKLAHDPTAHSQSPRAVAPGAELEPGGHCLQRNGAGSPYRLASQIHAASPPAAPAAECDPDGQGVHSTTTDTGYGGGQDSFVTWRGRVLVALAAVAFERPGEVVAAGLAAVRLVSFLQNPALQRQSAMLELHKLGEFGAVSKGMERKINEIEWHKQ